MVRFRDVDLHNPLILGVFFVNFVSVEQENESGYHLNGARVPQVGEEGAPVTTRLHVSVYLCRRNYRCVGGFGQVSQFLSALLNLVGALIWPALGW